MILLLSPRFENEDRDKGLKQKVSCLTGVFDQLALVPFGSLNVQSLLSWVFLEITYTHAYMYTYFHTFHETSYWVLIGFIGATSFACLLMTWVSDF